MRYRLLIAASMFTLAAVTNSANAQEVRGPEQVGEPSQNSSSNAAADGSDGASREFVGLEEIIVSARKIEESLQQVPVAVTAFSGAELQAQSAVRVTDIARLTPGLRVPPSTNPGAQNFVIRGQIGGVSAAQDQAVGIYVDGLYWARAIGLDVDLLDLKSAQVLKGPQGTLFGRNTTGGAILLESNDPKLDAVSGLVSGTYGRFDERSATGIVNLPIVPDRVALRVAGSFNKRDGYVRNFDGRRLGERDNWTGRAKLLVQASDAVSLTLLGELYRSDAQAIPFLPVFIGPNSALNFPVGISLFGPVGGTATVATRTAQGAAYFQDLIAQSRSGNVASLDFGSRVKTKTKTFSGTINIDTSFGAVKIISGYRRLSTQGSLDFDTTPAPVLYLPYDQRVKQFSIEPQITGKAFNDAVDFAAGLFFFRESGLDTSPFSSFLRSPATSPTVTLNQTTDFRGFVRTRSMGLYTQATWHVTDRLGVTGGIRYSVDDKGILNVNRTASGGCALTSGVGAPVAPLCEFRRDDSFSAISYLAGLDYQFTDDILGYAKVSRGFRSGGQNLRAVGNVAQTAPFQPETVQAYEIGLKSQFFDRRLRINLAAFRNDVSDLQRSTITAITIGGVTSATSIQGNFGMARYDGAEAEVSALVVPGLTLSATAAYLNPRYTSFIDPGTGIDRSGELFTDPEFTYSLAGSYTHDFDFGSASLRVDYSHDSSRQLVSLPFSPARDPLYNQKIAATTVKGNGLLNARIGVTLMDGDLDLAVFGRNLTNNRSAIAGNSQPFDLVTVLRRDPRTYGVTATFRFGAN